MKKFAGKCGKFKKLLFAHLQKHLEENDRVVVIGITDEP